MVNKKPTSHKSEVHHSSPSKRKPPKRMSVYANLANKRKTKKDADSRKRAEYLATLPKHPVKRFFYRLHPKRVFGYLFSKRGGIMILKVMGVGLLLAILMIGGMFAYFRKDLDKIRPGEIAKRVQTTVTKYYDRNDTLLWEDTGGNNYKLVVESDKISKYLKDATVAIEDKDFYKHHGVSISGIIRAFFSNTSGGQVQGGSTLTQQLVKQVFISEEEAAKRGLNGIPRKIKEVILAVEVERMYDKDQILSLYLNESPYGGRRNGAESAAQTYFHKSAKDLTLPEAALLAGIPQSPTYYNPYNLEGRQALLNRQHTVLDYMAQQNYITQKEADDAKKYPIFDTIQPENNDLENIKAPHFVLMVRSQLERELGKAVVGRGGLTVKTTLDWRVQDKLENEMKTFFNTGRPAGANISNGSAVVEDTQTGQIIGLLGSRDFNQPGFGQANVAAAYTQPGSSIKPFVFSDLMRNKGDGKMNYGSGSILADENIDRLYGAQLRNYDGKFMGAMTIRRGLALSRNIPAVKAMYIAGDGQAKPTVDFIREMGNLEYCKPEESAGGYGLSAAIGGCGSKQIDLTNSYSTLSRMGVYKQTASILEVKNSQGETLKKWKDTSKPVLDPQVAYIISDILADNAASAGLHGGATIIPGVKASTKTGTSDKGGKAKDLWIASYTPSVAMTLWLGNNDTSTLNSINSSFGAPIMRNVMSYTHRDIYTAEGKWNSGSWFTRPGGIQQQGNELYPSWWNKKQGQTATKMTFDRVSKKKATDCTPDAAREEIEVMKSTDPITKKEVFIAPAGYKANEDDDTHRCSDAKPTIASISASKSGGSTYDVSVSITNGTFNLATADILLNGTVVKSVSLSPSGGTISAQVTASSGNNTITVNVRDEAYYTANASKSFQHGGGGGGGNNNNAQ